MWLHITYSTQCNALVIPVSILVYLDIYLVMFVLVSVNRPLLTPCTFPQLAVSYLTLWVSIVVVVVVRCPCCFQCHSCTLLPCACMCKVNHREFQFPMNGNSSVVRWLSAKIWGDTLIIISPHCASVYRELKFSVLNLAHAGKLNSTRLRRKLVVAAVCSWWQ